MRPLHYFFAFSAPLLVALFLQACSTPYHVIEPRAVIGEKQGDVSFSWKISDSRPDVSQSAYQIDVKSPDGTLVWSSGKVEDGNSLYVPYGGPALNSCSKYLWNVTAWTKCGDRPDTRTSSAGGTWLTGLKNEEWTAKWIGINDQPAVDSLKRVCIASRYLRRQFTARSNVKSAYLYICGLGSSIAFINGKRVGNDVFGSLPTWYPVSEDYLVYDVSKMVGKGENAIGVELGNGRFSGPRMAREMYRGVPRLIAQLRIQYADGTSETILTDESWMATDKGPITSNNEFDGENYDARLDLGNWSSAGYVCGDVWKKADVLDSPGGVLRQQNSPAIKVQDEVNPVKVYGTGDGRVIVDMGQNMTGWLKVSLAGVRDSTIRMRFAEVLQKDDSTRLYVDNLRTAKVTDSYIPDKDGIFTWEPSFVYHGFRFVEITGLNYVPAAASFKGEVIYDEMQTTGSFESSNEVLNAIHHNAFWGIRSNYRGMPTDCPQRDERQGWLGDRATGCYGESFIFDNEYLYNKWLLDIEESMNKDGCISVVSPRYWTIFNGDVTWPSAFFYGADMLHSHFGNTLAVKSRYPAMKKWVEYTMKASMVDSILVKDTYGDWCMPPESEKLIHSKDPSRITSAPVLSTTVFYDILNKMQGFAKLAGCPEDAAKYAADAANIRKAFNAKYFDTKNGSYDNNTVTANLLALRLGLVPEEYKDRLVENIVDKTKDVWNSHVSGGVLGIQHLMRGLTENNQVDLAFLIASSRSYPSWGYMIDSGASTIWELWNGNTADPAMNSRNHVMLLGDLVIWFYEDLAGIKSAAPGFKEIEMAPSFPAGLDHVNASYVSPYGKIISSWKLSGGKIVWNVTIPANTTATVRLPGKFGASASGPGVHSVKTVNGETVIKLGSGSYLIQ